MFLLHSNTSTKVASDGFSLTKTLILDVELDR